MTPIMKVDDVICAMDFRDLCPQQSLRLTKFGL